MELKPCPFCGGEAVARHKISFPAHGERADEYYVYCIACGAKGPAYDADAASMETGEDIFRSAERVAQKAADAWNRRTEDG